MSVPPLPPPLGNYEFSPRRPPQGRLPWLRKSIFRFSLAAALGAGALLAVLTFR